MRIPCASGASVTTARCVSLVWSCAGCGGHGCLLSAALLAACACVIDDVTADSSRSAARPGDRGRPDRPLGQTAAGTNISADIGKRMTTDRPIHNSDSYAYIGYMIFVEKCSCDDEGRR
jgi:hypothetical protein